MTEEQKNINQMSESEMEQFLNQKLKKLRFRHVELPPAKAGGFEA